LFSSYLKIYIKYKLNGRDHFTITTLTLQMEFRIYLKKSLKMKKKDILFEVSYNLSIGWYPMKGYENFVQFLMVLI
jgi:hypothetical protein